MSVDLTAIDSHGVQRTWDLGSSGMERAPNASWACVSTAQLSRLDDCLTHDFALEVLAEAPDAGVAFAYYRGSGVKPPEEVGAFIDAMLSEAMARLADAGLLR